MTDLRQFAPATQRNRDPILAVLQRVLPPGQTVLEIASGTGEHAVYFAAHLRDRPWIPSDPQPEAIASIAAWQALEPIPNLAAPLRLDVRQGPWPLEAQALPELLPDLFPQLDAPLPSLGAIVCINMIHISPWESTLALFDGAARLLPEGGVVYLYGPYRQQGQHTVPSNEAFDASLRSRDPRWGVRDLETVIAVAAERGLVFQEAIAMPANNLSVILRKTPLSLTAT